MPRVTQKVQRDNLHTEHWPFLNIYISTRFIYFLRYASSKHAGQEPRMSFLVWIYPQRESVAFLCQMAKVYAIPQPIPSPISFAVTEIPYLYLTSTLPHSCWLFTQNMLYTGSNGIFWIYSEAINAFLCLLFCLHYEFLCQQLSVLFFSFVLFRFPERSLEFPC